MHAGLSRPTHMGSWHGQDEIMLELERGAGLDDMHCSRSHARSCTCRDVCTGIRTRADNLVLAKFGFSALSVPRFFYV